MHYISLFLTRSSTEAKMPMIQITGAIPDTDHPLSMRESLIDLCVEAKEHTIKWLREKNPALPEVLNTHEVATIDLVEALGRKSADNRTLNCIAYWSRVADNRRVIYIPYDCAAVMETT